VVSQLGFHVVVAVPAVEGYAAGPPGHVEVRRGHVDQYGIVAAPRPHDDLVDAGEGDGGPLAADGDQKGRWGGKRRGGGDGDLLPGVRALDDQHPVHDRRGQQPPRLQELD
jgi:hypothetical protein